MFSHPHLAHFVISSLSLLTVYSFLYQGPYSYYNNEDLIQKSKHVCESDFLNLC